MKGGKKGGLGSSLRIPPTFKSISFPVKTKGENRTLSDATANGKRKRYSSSERYGVNKKRVRIESGKQVEKLEVEWRGKYRISLDFN